MKYLLTTILAISFLDLFAQAKCPPNYMTSSEVVTPEVKTEVVNEATVLELRNNTEFKIFVATLKWIDEDKSWTSKGWWAIEPYGTKKFQFGTYVGKTYIHAHTAAGSAKKTTWGDKFSFCVDPTNKFEILFADKINCTSKNKFFEVNLRSGLNKHTLNP